MSQKKASTDRQPYIVRHWDPSWGKLVTRQPRSTVNRPAVEVVEANRDDPKDPDGKLYGIVVMDNRPKYPAVTLEEIKTGVDRFILYADRRRHVDFNVDLIGCKLGKFTPEQIAPMFQRCPGNVILPEEFRQVLYGQDQPFRVLRGARLAEGYDAHRSGAVPERPRQTSERFTAQD